MTKVQDRYDIVLFDGVCNLCNQAIDFVMQNDPKGHFKFGALQEENTQELLKEYEVDKNYLDSIVLVRKNRIYYKSRAALEISRKLKGLWPLLYIFILIPNFLRNPLYDWIARNRYKWFGKKETCRLPTPQEKDRFL